MSGVIGIALALLGPSTVILAQDTPQPTKSLVTHRDGPVYFWSEILKMDLSVEGTHAGECPYRIGRVAGSVVAPLAQAKGAWGAPDRGGTLITLPIRVPEPASPSRFIAQLTLANGSQATTTFSILPPEFVATRLLELGVTEMEPVGTDGPWSAWADVVSPKLTAAQPHPTRASSDAPWKLLMGPLDLALSARSSARSIIVSPRTADDPGRSITAISAGQDCILHVPAAWNLATALTAEQQYEIIEAANELIAEISRKTQP